MPTASQEDFNSWGHYAPPEHAALAHPWQTDPLPGAAPGGTSVLPFGLGRSYGDCCRNDGNRLLSTRQLRHFLDFDAERGVLRCESGVSLSEILALIVPHGWFLPTTPGTRWVTVGGAIANDVHGKNHHHAGTFGCHVRALELLRSDGERLRCSPTTHTDLFQATIGGLGLTGLITWAEIGLVPIQSATLETESIRFESLETFREISEEDAAHPFTVAWLDAAGTGRRLGRGIYMRGRFGNADSGPLEPHRERTLTVPKGWPSFLLNRASARLFNTAYFRKQGLRKTVRSREHYNAYFYPLDAIGRWYRLYGNRGFYQYQFVIPETSAVPVLKDVLACIARSGETPFLSVLKRCGSVRSPGMLSFPRPGYSLALDFANRGDRTRQLFRALDALVDEAGGRHYPAKDALLPAALFQKQYPQWRAFRSFVDPGFSSSLWRRYTES